MLFSPHAIAQKAADRSNSLRSNLAFCEQRQRHAVVEEAEGTVPLPQANQRTDTLGLALRADFPVTPTQECADLAVVAFAQG